MSKLLVRMSAVAMLGLAPVLTPAAVQAAILGPHANECAAGSDRPAMLVRILGLKSRTGNVRVQSYGGDPARFFAKGSYLERVDVRTPAEGPVEICMIVPRPGTYAVSVRHDLNGSGSSDLSDGGGFSGNPSVSLMDVAFKRRPSPERVEVKVAGVTRVPIVLNYVQGMTVKPIASAER